MNTLGKRLKHAREVAGLSQQALAEQVGIRQQTIQKIEAGIRKRTTRILEIAAAVKVDATWLLTGQGEMCPYTPAPGGRGNQESAPVAALPPRLRVLVELFEGLTEAQQMEVIRELQETQQRNEAIYEALVKKQGR